MRRLARVWVFTGILVAAIILTFALPRIPQDTSYHLFADTRTFFDVPNCLNVISNAGFLFVGPWGIVFLLRRDERRQSRLAFVHSDERWPYIVFFVGVGLTAFGSGYYHLRPGTERLVWDRLPMAVAFMALVAAMMAERVKVKAGLLSLLPLLAAGAASVFYWQATELKGAGDLRFYGLVQFGSLLAILLLVLLFPARYTRSADFLVALLLYALAKLCEAFDRQIFSLGRIVSGHTLKHLAAALAIYWILRMVMLRTPRVEKASL